MNFKRFGWRGVTFLIPEDWDLTVDGGGEKSGYFRIDDPSRPRLEIKWEYVPFEKASEPKEIAEKYVKELKKKLEKQAKAIAKARKLKKVEVPEVKILKREELSIAGHDAFSLYIRGYMKYLGEPQDAIFTTWYCEKTERYFSLQLNFSPEEYSLQKGILNKVYSTLLCHPKNNLYYWNVYGLEFYIPSEYTLQSRRFTTSLSYLALSDRKKNCYIVIAYNTMASILLEEYYHDLTEWFKNALQKQVINNICKFKVKKSTSVSVKGHKGQKLYGESFGVLKSLKYYANSYVWVCDKTNRIVSITVLSKGKENRSLLESILRMTRCH